MSFSSTTVADSTLDSFNLILPSCLSFDNILQMHNERNEQADKNTGELIQINVFRMYLQIAYLSDMISADGKYILPNFIT